MIDRPLTLIIIDNDPIFRLGLVQALSSTGVKITDYRIDFYGYKQNK
ncbi:hypothetical protein PN470_18555 [Microcystis sp. CS-574]|nr:hypothetical protein [Microcystis sp. CS-574]MDB9406233.1 hypothetical protein [Microcystis sp. CS-574]